MKEMILIVCCILETKTGIIVYKKDGVKCWLCAIRTPETVALLSTYIAERTANYQRHNSPELHTGRILSENSQILANRFGSVPCSSGED